MCAGAGTSVPRLSMKSSNQNGRSAIGSLSSFLSIFRDSCSNLLVACSSRRSDTEAEDELDAALFRDAWSASALEDELHPDLTDSPGTTRGTKFCLSCKEAFSHFGQPWVLTADPLIGVNVIFAKLA